MSAFNEEEQDDQRADYGFEIHDPTAPKHRKRKKRKLGTKRLGRDKVPIPDNDQEGDDLYVQPLMRQGNARIGWRSLLQLV